MSEDTIPTVQVLAEKVIKLERIVEGHDLTLDGDDHTSGIRTRLAILEDRYSALDKKINAVLAMLVTMILGASVITYWFITQALPELYRSMGH